MMRPSPFQNPHIALRNLPYASVDGSALDTPTLGGVLCSGQTVWTAETFTGTDRPRSALAFVDGIGTVRLDPRWIGASGRTAISSPKTPLLSGSAA